MATFLHGEKLNNAIYDIIYNAKKGLLIMSPYIKLDQYFKKEILDKHKGNANLQIIIVFGKNPSDISRSFKLEDFEYFKGFPNISIVYVPNLHAKYYANESSGLITSINLYDYSFRNNIEFGVLFESTFLSTDKIDDEAWTSAWEIIEENYVIFHRTPTFKKRLFGKDYLGSITKFDVIDELVKEGIVSKKCITDFEEEGVISVFEKEGARRSREEFEKEENSNQNAEQYPAQKEIKIGLPEPNESIRVKGACIRCGVVELRLDPSHPYCKSCYHKWNKYEKFPEKFCHICGKSEKTSYLRPACATCFNKNKVKLKFQAQ